MDINRKKALDILIDFDRNGTYPNLALKKQLRDIPSERDRAFITALVYGVIEKRLLLDYYISKVSSVKLKKIDTVILNILRLGLYQIIFLNTPQSAACNTSVELAKKNGRNKSSGFVNAILRKLSVSFKDIPLPASETEYLSVKYSVGIPIVKKLLSYHDKTWFENYMIKGENVQNDVYACVNTLKTDTDRLISILHAQHVDAKKTDYQGLIKFGGHINIENLKAFKDGLFHIIGLPSYIAAKSVCPLENDIVFDMCSAPGGKSFAMSYLSNGKADITAFDLHPHKIENIKNDIIRLGLKNITAIVSDSSKLQEKYIGTVDKILCDVPCSGLGVMFKKPDIKYNETDFESLITLQKSILENASKYLKNGGRLVYSTCTVNPEENELLVNDFLNSHNEFIIDNSKTFSPADDGCEGFYIAVLKKRGGLN